MSNESRNNITISSEAVNFLKTSPETLLKIKGEIKRSTGTLTNWIYNSPEKFTANAALKIIARAMKKKVSEIIVEQKQAA